MDIEHKILGLSEARHRFQIKPKFIGITAVVLIAFIGFWGSWFQVGADSVGMVMRLGKFVRKEGPGLHTKFPFGIEEVLKVPTETQLKDEFGYRTVKAGVDSRYSTKDFPEESLMLTGDLNVVNIEWSVQYRIVDPKKYLFDVRNVRETFRHMTQAAMREVIGDRTVNEVLTVGRAEISDAVRQRLQKLCTHYTTGIRVEQVILQEITPPEPVKPSFNEVNQSQQQKEQMINQAKADYNKAVPSARGEAQRTLQQAQGYAINRVNRAEGDVARFNSLYAEYKKAPEVTRRRIFIETMGKMLPQVKKKIIIDGSTEHMVPLLPLGNLSTTRGAAGQISAQTGGKR